MLEPLAEGHETGGKAIAICHGNILGDQPLVGEKNPKSIHGQGNFATQGPVAMILTGLCALFLALLLVAEVRSSTRLRFFAKPLASACFVALALVVMPSPSVRGAYPLWILVGLVLGAGGDVALLFSSQRSFLLGLVSFLLGHAAYVAACATLVPLGLWPSAYALAPMLAALPILAYLWPHLGSMRVPVLLYVATIVMMVIGAIAVYRGHGDEFTDEQALLLLVGAVLFFVSDVAVAKSRFVSAEIWDRMWGLPAYYAGQVLIAWSLLT